MYEKEAFVHQQQAHTARKTKHNKTQGKNNGKGMRKKQENNRKGKCMNQNGVIELAIERS